MIAAPGVRQFQNTVKRNDPSSRYSAQSSICPGSTSAKNRRVPRLMQRIRLITKFFVFFLDMDETKRILMRR